MYFCLTLQICILPHSKKSTFMHSLVLYNQFSPCLLLELELNYLWNVAAKGQWINAFRFSTDLCECICVRNSSSVARSCAAYFCFCALYIFRWWFSLLQLQYSFYWFSHRLVGKFMEYKKRATRKAYKYRYQKYTSSVVVGFWILLVLLLSLWLYPWSILFTFQLIKRPQIENNWSTKSN